MNEEQKKKKAEFLAALLKSIDKYDRLFGTMQEKLHKNVLLEVTRYVFIYKDTSPVQKLFDTFEKHKGVRIESIAYWFQHVAGIAFEHNEKKGFHGFHLAKDEYQSDLKIAFSYDKIHLDECRKIENRYWKVAPVLVKPLKAPELDKATASAETQLARGLAIGVLTQEEVETHILEMLDRVRDAVNSKAVKKWTADYFLQNSASDAETTEEFNEELLED